MLQHLRGLRGLARFPDRTGDDVLLTCSAVILELSYLIISAINARQLAVTSGKIASQDRESNDW